MMQRESLAGLEFENWYFLGQENTVLYFKNALSKDALFQTLLFSGPEHLGKKALAIRVAAAFICQDGVRPCFRCVSCKKILNFKSESLIILDEKRISIKTIRELKRKLSLKQSQKFFCIIDDYQSLSMEAEHALLKILEEPNQNIHFIILSKNKGSVLKTVLSRSLVFTLNRVTDQQIEDYFRANDISYNQEVVNFISGRPGLAKQYVLNKDIVGEFLSHKKLLKTVLKSNLPEKFLVAKKVAENEDLDLLFSEWISLFRKEMLVKASGKTISVSLGDYSIQQISQIIKNLEASKSLLKKNVNKKLILENVFLNV